MGLSSPIPTETPSKPITVTVEEKRVQRVKPGADVTFVCTAKSKVSQGDTLGCLWGHAGCTGTPLGAPWAMQSMGTPLHAHLLTQGV